MAALRGVIGILPVMLGLALLSGCGKKGALVPPEALVPAPVSSLAVAQKASRLQVSWNAPTKEQGGAPLKDLAGFQLFKRVVLPPGQDCEECAGAYPQMFKFDLEYLQGARRIGNLFLFDDQDITRGKTYQYKVRSFTADGALSRDSNLARRTVFTPPPPPVAEANFSETGVVLTFSAPQPAEGSLAGYNVYRSKDSSEMPLSPLNSAPLTGPAYQEEDLLVGVRYSYWVTTLATVNGEMVESAPSSPAAGSVIERQ